MNKRTILTLIAVAVCLCSCCFCVLALTGFIDTDIAGQVLGLGGFALGTLVVFGVPLAIVATIIVLILKRIGIIR